MTKAFEQFRYDALVKYAEEIIDKSEALPKDKASIVKKTGIHGIETINELLERIDELFKVETVKNSCLVILIPATLQPLLVYHKDYKQADGKELTFDGVFFVGTLGEATVAIVPSLEKHIIPFNCCSGEAYCINLVEEKTK